MADTDSFNITSEELEPTAALVVGRLFARFQAARTLSEKETTLNNLWWAVNALSSLAVAVGTAPHFSIASANHIGWTADLIQRELGIDPMSDQSPLWKFR